MYYVKYLVFINKKAEQRHINLIFITKQLFKISKAFKIN